jgi:hypothetical protein
MPRGKAIIFLAGHGAVSVKNKFVDDNYLKNHHVTFPAKIKGQLCFVAHNIILQSLINCRNSVDELEKLENYHGISKVSISNGRPIYLLFPDGITCQVDLSDLAHRQQLQKFLQYIQDISKAKDQDLQPLLDKYSEMQTGIFAEVRMGFCLADSARREALEGEITKILGSNSITDKACMLLEHKLGSWESSMAKNPWQAEMPYSPATSSSYERHTLCSIHSTDNTRLDFYVDKSKIEQVISDEQEKASPERFKNKKLENGVIYITTPSREPVLLSKILELLHKIHIYVSQFDKKVVIRGVFVIENPEDIAPNDIDRSQQVYEWYDFTIPDDANVVWGACRDDGDF